MADYSLKQKLPNCSRIIMIVTVVIIIIIIILLLLLLPDCVITYFRDFFLEMNTNSFYWYFELLVFVLVSDSYICFRSYKFNMLKLISFKDCYNPPKRTRTVSFVIEWHFYLVILYPFDPK